MRKPGMTLNWYNMPKVGRYDEKCQHILFNIYNDIFSIFSKSEWMETLNGKYKIKIPFHLRMSKFGLPRLNMASLQQMLTLKIFNMRT